MSNRSISCFLIDDEAGNNVNLQLLLERYCTNVKVLETFTNPLKALEAVKANRPELLFLDVEMPDLNGFDLLEQLGQDRGEVIFITAYEQYALKAFEFAAVDYLTKPVDVDRLQAAVTRVCERITRKEVGHGLEEFLRNRNQKTPGKKRLAISSVQEIRFVEIGEITRCEGENNYTHFHLASGERLTASKPLREYEELLCEDGFLRVHQSHLINSNFLKRFVKTDGGYLEMNDQTQVPVSRSKKSEVIEVLTNS